jgi:hypothetical protein
VASSFSFAGNKSSGVYPSFALLLLLLLLLLLEISSGGNSGSIIIAGGNFCTFCKNILCLPHKTLLPL